MNEPLRDCLLRQLDTAWTLAEFHLDGLTIEDCLWRPAARGPHVRRFEGSWVADWPIDENYQAGPPSIAWIGWHLLFWWSMAIDHNFGGATLEREDVGWPSDPEGSPGAHRPRAKMARCACRFGRLNAAIGGAGALAVPRPPAR